MTIQTSKVPIQAVKVPIQASKVPIQAGKITHHKLGNKQGDKPERWPTSKVANRQGGQQTSRVTNSKVTQEPAR